MKKCVFLFILICNSLALAEVYVGIGFAWNTIDETFDSKLYTNENKSGQDRYDASVSRLAPVVQLGYQLPFCNDWVIGVLAEWKYLNYKTPNENSSRGQILPNATFSSINFFGPEVIRDFTSKTQLNNEVLLLGYLGMQMAYGYGYLGLGPVCFTSSNRIYVSSVHIPNGVGDHLISTSVTSHKTMWGGAAQIGYQYCLNPNSLINVNYTYIQSGKYRFNNTINAALLNGADSPGAVTLFLRRTIKFAVQEFMLSINLAF